MKDQLPIIKAFVKNLLGERHFSPYTARWYAADLGQFAEHLRAELGDGSSLDVDDERAAFERRADTNNSIAGTVGPRTITGAMLDATSPVIRTFLTALQAKHEYSSATMVRKVASLRCFYRWLQRRKVVHDNPMEAIQTPRHPKRPPRAIDAKQIERLLSTPDPSNLLGARDRAILEVLYSTGCRVSELVAMNRGDLSEDGMTIMVRGRNARRLPLGAHARSALTHYFEMLDVDPRSSRLGPAADAEMFINKSGNRISTRSVRRKVSKYLDMAGLDPTISPHTLRHSLAAHLLEKGVEVRAVQRLLGHQSVATTQVYANLAARARTPVFPGIRPRAEAG